MSSCASFQHSRDLTSSFLAYQMPYEPFSAVNSAAADVPGVRHHMKTERTRARQVMMLMPACASCAPRIEVTEEVNVEFQRCGPQSPGCSQGGQTHKSDGAGRQGGLRCLWHPGSQ